MSHSAEKDALARVQEVLAEREQFEGAVLANERYGEGFCDGWAAAIADVRATLAYVFPSGKDSE